MENFKAPRMLSIRETAKLGILSENALRAGVKKGWVPGLYVGVKYLVNVDRLIDLLNGTTACTIEKGENRPSTTT